MAQQHNLSSGFGLPHHRLHVYGKALELLAAVRAEARAFAIARGECVECVAAVEIAAAAGDAVGDAAARAVACGGEVYLMLGALVR